MAVKLRRLEVKGGPWLRTCRIWLLVLLLGLISLTPTAQAQTPTTEPRTYRVSDDEFRYAGTFSDIALDIDAYWKEQFARERQTYSSPSYTALDRTVQTACGRHGPEADAFYCQLDLTIYLNPDFLATQDEQFGDYAPIVVLAHEWGHHVQNLLQVPDLGDNSYELQADCLAGAYTLNAEEKGFLDPGDLSEAIRISEEFGDPVGLPQDQPGAHGTNAQRMKAVMRGYLDGIVGCKLFEGSGDGGTATPIPTRTTSRTPTHIPTPTLTAGDGTPRLPDSLPLPHSFCFDVNNEGSLAFGELADRLGGTEEARQSLNAWGWRGSAFRTFGCDGPPEGEAGWIDISLHQFGDAAAAREAVDYFAEVRADGTALVPVAAPVIGDHAAALTGPASNGSEFTLYASQGPLLVRVTGVSPSGIPFMNVLAVAQSVLADNMGVTQSNAVDETLPPVPAYPASAYLPLAPAVNHAECFQVRERGSYDSDDVADALLQAGMTSDQVAAIGWTDGAYVVFSCADPPVGRANQIDVGVHQFRDGVSAQQALPYYSAMYDLGANAARSCDATDALVVCVSGRSLSGSPLSDVHFVLNQVVGSAR